MESARRQALMAPLRTGAIIVDRRPVGDNLAVSFQLSNSRLLNTHSLIFYPRQGTTQRCTSKGRGLSNGGAGSRSARVIGAEPILRLIARCLSAQQQR